MQVRVSNSTDIFVFSLYDKTSGEELIFDFLETHCAFVAEKFIYLEDENIYVCEPEVLDKWKYIIDQQNALSERISSLRIEHGELFVNEIINKAFFRCIEEEADAINYELDRAFSD